MPTMAQLATGQVATPSLVVRDNNFVDTGDRFVLGTKLQILGSDASGAYLQVSGPNADGQPTIGYVKKEFVQTEVQTKPTPPSGSAAFPSGGVATRGSGASGATGGGASKTLPADIIAAAQASQGKWGIPASVTIAQWALESGWGKYMPPDSNNPFGIKAIGQEPFVSALTQEYQNGQKVTVSANFRKFATIADAFDAHAQLLATSPRYASARNYEGNPTDFAKALTGVYATDPNYGTALNSIIQGSNLRQYDVVAQLEAQPEGGVIQQLISHGSDPTELQRCQAIAAKRLLDFDGEKYPSDGCAITLSVLLQDSGIFVPDTYMAIDLGTLLKNRGWQEIRVGDQKAGDIGSTCGQVAQHGTDHIYLVLQAVNYDEMVVADNQVSQPHFRFASGKGRTPTTFFLRAAPDAA